MNNICTISFGALLISTSSTLMADPGMCFDSSVPDDLRAQFQSAIIKTVNSKTNLEDQSLPLPSFKPHLPEPERRKRWEDLKSRVTEAQKKSDSKSFAFTDSESDVSDSARGSNKPKKKKLSFSNFLKKLSLSSEVSERDSNKLSSQTSAMLEQVHLEKDIQALEAKRADKESYIEQLKSRKVTIQKEIETLKKKKAQGEEEAKKAKHALQTRKKSIIAWLKSSKVRSEQKNLRLKAKEAKDNLQKVKIAIQLEENKLDFTFTKFKLKQESQELCKIRVSLNQLLLKKSKLELTIAKNSEKAFSEKAIKDKNINLAILALETQKNIKRLELEIIQLEGKLKYENKFKKHQRKLEDDLYNLNMNEIEEVDAYFVFLNREARKLTQTRDKMVSKKSEKYAEKIYYIEKLLEIIKRNHSIARIQGKYTPGAPGAVTVEHKLIDTTLTPGIISEHVVLETPSLKNSCSIYAFLAAHEPENINKYFDMDGIQIRGFIADKLESKLTDLNIEDIKREGSLGHLLLQYHNEVSESNQKLSWNDLRELGDDQIIIFLKGVIEKISGGSNLEPDIILALMGQLYGVNVTILNSKGMPTTQYTPELPEETTAADVYVYFHNLNNKNQFKADHFSAVLPKGAVSN